MARSKRTNKTAKNDKARKQDLYTTVRALLPTHPHLHLFRLTNPRAAFFQRVRLALSPSCVFFLGKNKVLQKALTTEGASDQIAGFVKKITHNVGVVVSQLERAELEDRLAGLLAGMCEYARVGSVAPFAVTIEPTDQSQRVLCRVDSGEQVSATSEPVLRAAGMPTMLRGGQVVLSGEESGWEVCKAGDKLSADQVKVLRLFGVKLDDFDISILDSITI